MPDVSKRLEKAERLLLKGKHHDALKELLRASEEDPQNDSVRLKAADLSATLHRNAEAARLYGQAFNNQAAIGDLAAAALTYKKMAHLGSPAVEQTLRYAGLIEKANRDEALAAYRAAREQLPGQAEKALEAQRRIVALQPSAREFEVMANLETEIGDHGSAAQSLLQAAECAVRDGNDEAEFEYLRRAYESDPANRAAVLRVGAALLAQERFDDSAAVLRALAASNDAEAAALYARALLQSGKLEEAEPHVWAAYQRDASQIKAVTGLIEQYVAAGNTDAALALAHRLEVRETGHRRRRDFILLVKDVVMRHEPQVELLSYVAELLNSANREHDYCDVLGRLFDIYFANGEFAKAADALDRAGEVDPYDQANQRRLTALQGKVDDRRYQAVATRFGKAAPVAASGESSGPASSHPTVLEDLMLQAEIFLQYGMSARAHERLRRIERLFPAEQANNAQLQELFERAAYTPMRAALPLAQKRAVAAPRPPSSAESDASTAVEDQLTRIADVAHNLLRQRHVDAVLFAAAHDIGRLLGASRCIVALCSPGGPPSAFAEYCAPGIDRSAIDALAELVTASGKELKGNHELLLHDAAGSPGPMADSATTLGMASLAVAALTIREEFTGVLLTGHAVPHEWTKTESSALALLAGQVAAATHDARMRKMLDAVAPREHRTGLLKRSAYFDALTFEIKRSLQHRAPLSVAFLRMPAGGAHLPQAMEQLAQCLLPHIRQTDIAVRYDPSTIALILGDTHETGATQAIKKLQRVMRRSKDLADLTLQCAMAEALIIPDYDPVDIATEIANRAEEKLSTAS